MADLIKKKQTFRCLLAVIVYSLTLKEIAELKRPRRGGPPPWSVNMETGAVIPTAFYHQFACEEALDAGALDQKIDDKYILFDFVHSSPILENEIAEAGFDCVFDKINMLPLFEALPKESYDEMGKVIPQCVYAVVDVTYAHLDYDDYDMGVSVVGYLDSQLSLCLTPCCETTPPRR